MFNSSLSIAKNEVKEKDFSLSLKRRFLDISPKKNESSPHKKLKEASEEKENVHLNSNTDNITILKENIEESIIQKNVKHNEKEVVPNTLSETKINEVNDALDDHIDEKEIRINEEKRQESFKALSYILAQSTVFSKILEDRLNNSKNQKPKGKTKKKTSAQLNIKFNNLQDSKADISQGNKIDISTYFENGVLRDYQLDGIEWLKVLFENGVNGILADEMGLGKTVQVIAFICYLYDQGITGPFLICVPLSTLTNWESEFKKFAPKLPVLIFHGDKDTRKDLAFRMHHDNFTAGRRKNCGPIVITTYQMPLIEKAAFARLNWLYIIVDEGHRLKNHESILYRVLQNLNSNNRLILTGTPLHNNLRELWSLLYFLLPSIFTDYEVFESWLDMDDLKNDTAKFIKQEQETQALSTMHNILKPFFLRRLKSDVTLDLPPKKELIVYCPLSPKQRDLYNYVLEKNIDELLNPNKALNKELPEKRRRKLKKPDFTEVSSDDEFEVSDDSSEPDITCFQEDKKELVRLTMKNPSMMYRKIVNHPYLVHFPLKPRLHENEEQQLLINEELVTQSGKMMILDALTSQLIARGHKILIFSTLTMMLDIIEEFVLMRNYRYCRLDGTMDKKTRDTAMNSFNSDNDIKIFLISTRAGGLGLNLVGADTVILYDSDWNPQADIQAQDRCHRIGQTKPVVVYQFVTRGTIDEAIIATGEKKRKLEKLIIHNDKFKLKGRRLLTEKEDLDLLKKLLSEEEKQIVTTVEEAISMKELDDLLDRSDLLEQMQKRHLN